MGTDRSKTPAIPESVTFQRCVPFAVEIGVTETRGSDAGTFHVEADIELIRHAHAAVHLQTLIRHQCRYLGQACLGDARDLRDVVAPVLNRRQCVEHHRAAEFDFREERRHAVLQRLEPMTLPNCLRSFR